MTPRCSRCELLRAPRVIQDWQVILIDREEFYSKDIIVRANDGTFWTANLCAAVPEWEPLHLPPLP